MHIHLIYKKYRRFQIVNDIMCIGTDIESFWQSYFHSHPMFKEIITYDGEWVKNSFITVSEKPGIGVEINEAGMKKYAIAGVPFFE